MSPGGSADAGPRAGRSAIVVGAGIVGATTAYELQKAGIATTLIDADAPGMGCSYGNAGAISPGSVAPLAMPGVLRSVLDMLRDPEGPLHVRPSYLPRALPWLLRFVAAARPARVERIAAQLHDLHRGAIEAHERLAREIGAPELVQRRGHLHLYPDEHALAKDAGSWSLRKRFGVSIAMLDRQGILDRIAAEKKKGKASVTRFKGLGEMNPLQLRETTMDPATRRLVQLTLDAGDDTLVLMDMLLAKKRAGDRKNWLEAKGNLAEV